MTGDPQPRLRTPFWRRPVMLALILSIGVNVFFAFERMGVVAGAATGGVTRAVEQRPRGDWVERRIAAAPEDLRPILRAAFAEKGDRIRALRKQGFEVRLRQMALLRAEPFDADGYRQTQSQARALAMRRRELIHAAWADAAEALSAAGRADLADTLEQRLRRRMRRFGLSETPDRAPSVQP